MPLALSPTETFDVALDLDEAIPAPERPTFVFHYLSSRAYRKRTSLLDDWDAYFSADAEDADEDADARRARYEDLQRRTFEALAAELGGYRHIEARDGEPMVPSYDDLDELLTDAEARELLAKTTRMSRLQVAEKKGSESPSPGATGDAAPADAPTTAPATTPPADSPEATDTSSSAPPAPAETPSAPSAEGTGDGS